MTIVVYRVAENGNIPNVCSYTTAAPRLSRKCKCGRHKYLISFLILICKNDFTWCLLQNAFYYYFTSTYISCRSIHPPTCAGKVLLHLAALVFGFGMHLPDQA